RYKRKGNSCLGIDRKKQEIVWENASSNKKQPHKRNERYFTKTAVRALRTHAVPVPCKTDTAGSGLEGFIPVTDHEGASLSCPTTSWVNPLGVYDASTSLWLQGKGAAVSETKEVAPREASDGVGTALMERVEEYNRRTRENPEDIQTWMEFVSFQDELIFQPSMYSTSKGEMERHRKSVRLLLEKKVSILEKAIERNPGSMELKLARLRLCGEFWEAPSLLKEWQKLIFLHPNNPQLWLKYLLLCQSQFSTFSVSKVNSIYGKCLSTLAGVQDGSMLSHPPLPGTESCMYAVSLPAPGRPCGEVRVLVPGPYGLHLL
ncbi:hypothetical protein FKM82_025871, partial [Ascaphus truei]